jgi:succinate dehydrogenase/fumarate reductase flavoprotein subunit
MESTYTRRSLVKGAALGAAAAGFAAIPPIALAEGKDPAFDRECDFLVVGFGLAGAVAAIEANDIDPDANVLVIEKMDEAQAGGNSIASGQTVIVPSLDDLDTFKTYVAACFEPNAIPEEDLDWLCEEFASQGDWVQGTVSPVGYEIGYVSGGPVSWGKLVTEFPDLPGSNFVGCSGHVRAEGGTFEYGGVWRGFALAAQARENVEIDYGCAFTQIIVDADGRVVGVVADNNGTEERIGAGKGVLLACGGYENNLQMQRDFHGMDTVYTAGTPGNTGDGIQALMGLGAAMWHMRNQTQSGGFWLGIKVPDFESTFMRAFSMPGGSWIEVDAEDKRFYNEAGAYHRQHMKYKQYGHYIDLPHERALPVHLIFDDKTCQSGAIVTKWLSWPITTLGYTWSDDNSIEVEKGWIIKADTIAELAELTGRDPEALQLAIDTFNEGVASGSDEFGRDPETMVAIDTPPYYAVAITPTLVGTTGGAQRDTSARVLRWDGTPIEGLYEAGELGSFVANLYQNGMFLAECIASGRAAADHAFGGRSATFEPMPTEDLSSLIDITKKPDGVYEKVINGNEGKFTIEVTVESGRITDVQIVQGRENMFMTDELLQEYVDTVVDEQVVMVDGISGATLDINKLNQGMQELFADTAAQ